MGAMIAKRILLLALDGVTWPGLGAAMAAGHVPALTRLAAGGAIGPLAMPPQIGATPLWATLASGSYPEAHGLIGEDEVWAGGLRPAGHASWRAPPVWQRLEDAGIACTTVDWPATAPAAAWAGQHVDPRYAVATGTDWDDWALPLDCVPPDLRESLRDARVHPADVTGEMLAPLVPGLAAIDQARDPSLARIAVGMAYAASVQAAAAELIGRGDWRVALVHHRWLGSIRAVFDAAQDSYAGVVAGAWRFLDGMVGRLAQLAGEEATVLIVGSGEAGRAGTLIAAGASVTAGTAIEGARLIDMAPTVLAAFGWRDEALPGTPLAAIAPVAMQTLPPAVQPVPPIDTELLAQVTAAGYAPPPPPSLAWLSMRLAGLAQMLLPRNPAEALRAADAALAHMPDNPVALGQKAFALVALNRADGLHEIADKLDALAPDRPWGAIAYGAYHALRGEPAAAKPWLDRAVASDEGVMRLRAGAAWLVLARPHEARRAFLAAQELMRDDADAEIGLAVSAHALRRWQEAEEALRHVLARDPAHAIAWDQLAAVLHDVGRISEAEAAAAVARRLG